MCLVSCLYLNLGNNYWKIGRFTIQAEVLTDGTSFINSYVVILFVFVYVFVVVCLFVFLLRFAALYHLCIYENIDLKKKSVQLGYHFSFRGHGLYCLPKTQPR